jgi:hypothetical protein
MQDSYAFLEHMHENSRLTLIIFLNIIRKRTEQNHVINVPAAILNIKFLFMICSVKTTASEINWGRYDDARKNSHL